MSVTHEGFIEGGSREEPHQVDITEFLVSPDDDSGNGKVVRIETQLGLVYALRGIPGTMPGPSGDLNHVGFEVQYPQRDETQGRLGRIASVLSRWKQEGGRYPQRQAAVAIGNAVITEGGPLVINGEATTSPIVGVTVHEPLENPSGKPKHQAYEERTIF